jgi:hypothetical protein
MNGRDLGTARDRMNPRLIGKSPIAHIKNYPRAEGPWYRGGWWLLVYAPDSADHQIEEGDDCLFLWDVTDLLRPDGHDVIRLESQTKRIEEQIKRPIPLVVGRFHLGLVDAAVIASRLPPPLPVPPVANNARLTGKGFSCWLAPGGGLALTVGKESFLLRSQFTYPGRPKGGWNRLEPATKTEGEPGWKPTIKREASGNLSVTARGETYSLSRQTSRGGLFPPARCPHLRSPAMRVAGDSGRASNSQVRRGRSAREGGDENGSALVRTALGSPFIDGSWQCLASVLRWPKRTRCKL